MQSAFIVPILVTLPYPSLGVRRRSKSPTRIFVGPARAKVTVGAVPLADNSNEPAAGMGVRGDCHVHGQTAVAFRPGHGGGPLQGSRADERGQRREVRVHDRRAVHSGTRGGAAGFE